MARRIPQARFADLTRIAANIFVAKGYEQAQIDDVVAAMSVGKGTIYRFVSGKRALLQAALLYADHPPAELPSLPFTIRPTQVLRAHLNARLEPIVRELRRLQLAPEVLHARRALPELIEHVYNVMEAARFSIKLLESNPYALPEVAAQWRELFASMAELLAGFLRRQASVGGVGALARQPRLSHAVLQNVLYWSVHRHWDGNAPETSSVSARQLLRDLLMPALHPADQRDHNPADAAS